MGCLPRARSVTRLDGARGKKQVWRPHIRFWGLYRKQIHCIAESTCDIVGTFQGPPKSFGAAGSDSALGELCPCWPPPSLRPCHVHKRNLKIRWCPKCHLGNSRFRSSKSSNAVILALTATNSFIPTTRNGQFFEQSGQKTWFLAMFLKQFKPCCLFKLNVVLRKWWNGRKWDISECLF